MRHTLSQLLQWSNLHSPLYVLARAASNHALAGLPCDYTSRLSQQSGGGWAAQQHQDQRQQQQHCWQQQRQQNYSGLLLHQQRCLNNPVSSITHLLASQQQQQQQPQQEEQQGTAQPEAPKTPSSSDTGSSKEEASGSQGASSSTGDSAADGSSSSSSSGGGGGKDPPDEALIAEWRTASAQWYGSGLNFIVHGHLEMPNMSSWSFLYRQQPSLISQLIWPKGASAMTRLLRWNFAKASTVAVPLLEEAHGDFEAEEFTQCASQAIAAVLELYAAGDWVALRPMVSSGLLQSMQQAYEEQHQSVSNVHVDIQKLDIVCVHSITQQQLAAIDEQRAGQQLTPAELEAASGAASADGVGAAATAAAGQSHWDVCHVYVEVSWHADVRLGEDAAVSEVVQPRSGHWMLCRGPVLLNKAIPAEADKPWFMLAWM